MSIRLQIISMSGYITFVKNLSMILGLLLIGYKYLLQHIFCFILLVESYFCS